MGSELTTGEPKNIIVIGTSAGGLAALDELVRQFREEWDAAFFIVLHLSRKGISDFLVHQLQHKTSLPCVRAQEGYPIQRGRIYIAMPNFHLLLKEGMIRLGHGPEENRWRPSIDVLFRSAAVAYGSRVTGIILTGLMNDGTSGMWAIKRVGGALIVQDPNEAEYPDMPISVLNRMEVDFCVPLNEMGAVLEEVVKREPPEIPIPNDLKTEAGLAERMATNIETTASLGEQSFLTCPDCGGALFQINDDKIGRFRCYTGHAYSEEELDLKQHEKMEATFWVALRMMEERKNLLKKMEMEAVEKGYLRIASRHEERGTELQKHIDQLKEILFQSQEEKDTAS